MNLKVNSTLILFVALSLKLNVVLGFQKQESRKSFQEIARIDVNENTTPEQIMQFNAKAEELGFAKPTYFEKNASSSKIIFSNDVQLNLNWPLERVARITKDFVIVNERDRPEYPTRFIKRVYDRNGTFLFSQQNDSNFSLVLTELGFVFRMASRKPITLYDKFGSLINTFSNTYSINDWRMVHASPDKSYMIINSVINDLSGQQTALIAINSVGKELWRKPDLRSTRQLAISNKKVAIGHESGIVYVFDREGNQLREYPTKFKGDVAVTFSSNGKYLAAASTNRSLEDKSSYLYLIDDEQGTVIQNWPVHIHDENSSNPYTPIRLAILENKLIVTISNVLNRKYRVYDLTGSVIFETKFRKRYLDNSNVTEIDYKNNHLFINQLGVGRIFNLKK